MSRRISMIGEAGETWLFTNPRKLLFLILTERGSYGYVVDLDARPWARIATKDDMVTNQYTEARRVERGERPEGAKP